MANVKSTEVTKTESTQVAAFQGTTSLAERRERVGQGSENVSASDLAIPRLKLLQGISEEVQPGPMRVEGAASGMIMNSVTKELYNSLFVINLHFSKKTVVWKKRKLGGGMYGTFDSEGEALDALKADNEIAENYDIRENPTHLVMLLSAEGEPKGIALLDMPGTKVKVSRAWNTLIKEQEEAGNPRFGCVWELSVVLESNNEGNYNNLKVEHVVNAPDSIYLAAETAFDAFFGERQAA